MFVHLTTHSAYSLQEGLLLPSELAQAAADAGMPALGLTDHRLLSGSIEFASACKRLGVQPILGLEIDLDSGKLALLVTSLEGWSNLCRLSSALALRPEPEAPCPLDLLAEYSHDLLAIRGEQGDSSGGMLAALKEIFSKRLYVSLSEPSVALEVSALARRLRLPLVATHPVYYLTPDQAPLQRTLEAMRINQPLKDVPAGGDAISRAPMVYSGCVSTDGCHFLSAGEMALRFKGFPGALAATEEIAARCKFDLPLGVARMPVVPLPPGLTAAQTLRQKAEAGAVKLYGTITPEIHARLEHELETISRLGYEPIFLIVEELLDFARRAGVPFSSRGSAASSLVAHCLGITSPDPLRLDLFFERFLNPARTTPPDIDTDLCSRRRDLVIQHAFEVYGEERVAMVGIINRFRARSALGEVAKAHGLAPAIVRELVNLLPYAYFARVQEGEEGAEPRGNHRDTKPSVFDELRGLYPAPTYQRIFAEAEALLKLPRHLSVHAGGLIVAPGKLTDLVPVMRSGSKGVIITQLDLESVEALGLVKIDLLGIRGLTVLGDVAEFIFNSRPDEYADPLAVLDATPATDGATSSTLEHGQTIGCFQIESPGMRATLREIRARTEDDLMAALALYRPGPLSGGLKDAFVRRFKGEEPVAHLHPALAPLLDSTFGVILYQEQVLRIAHELAGFSLAEADLLRRAMSHFDPGKQMQVLEQKFVRGAHRISGVPPETGERLWEMMAAFAGYGFPKAHAASYARVGWRSAWCKTHFPAEFMAAVLANWGGYYPQRVYLSEARRLGLSVRPPHVNYSLRNFTVFHPTAGDAPGVLYMGLDQVKELTGRTIERIVRGRPFSSLEDFLARADPRPAEAESLAKVGGLEGIAPIPAVLRRLQGGGWQAGQPSLFEWGDSGSEEDWTLSEKVAAQLEILGASLDAHPLELVANRVAASGAISTVEAAGRIGRRVTVAGVRQSAHRGKTAKGDLMMFLTLEDLDGVLDAVLFPNVYRQARQALNASTPLLVTGVMEMDTGRSEPLLRAEKVVSL